VSRQIASDPFQLFSFHVLLPSEVGISAGFSKVTLPTYNVASVQYKTLLQKYTRKFPGPNSVSDITMSRGVMMKDTKLFEWIKSTQKVNVLSIREVLKEYRKDVIIIHHHRTGHFKKYSFFDSFPITFRLSSDLDALSNDVAIEELTLATEDYDIEEGDEEVVL
jgi:phage tail-like protein